MTMMRLRHHLDENCPLPTLSEERRSRGARWFAWGLIAAAFVGTLLLSRHADAQTTTVRTATLTWTGPSACRSGSAIANCPVLGYSIQKQQGANWVEIGTTANNVLTYVDRDIALGTHTYRVLATSANGPSDPSNPGTKVIDVPGTPGNIVITVTVTVTP